MLRTLLAMGLALGLVHGPGRAASPTGQYLYVFSGDQAGKGNAFVAVIDADPKSATYGKPMAAVATDQVSVRPHHTEYEMSASGMLFANDHNANRTFIFDLRDPLHPTVAATFKDLAGFAMPHSFLRLPNGHVLATFQQRRSGHDMAAMHDMAGMDGAELTGGIVEIDDAGKVVRAVSNADPAHADWPLLPYSLMPLPKIDRVLVTNSPMQDHYLFQSVTYQLFRLSDLQLLGTYQLDPGPSLSGHIDPEEVRIGPDGAAYIQTLSCGLQRVTGLDGANPKAVLVHQFPGTFCGVPTIAGHYLVQAVESIGGFVVLDIANGAKPVEVSRLTIAPGYASHWTAWDPATNRIVITSGKSGDRLYLLLLDPASGKLTIDESFHDTDGKPGLSMQRSWPHGWTGEGRPHGAVFSR
jgi:DNA-binding beta-propeller fold protein YncE